MYTTWAPSQVPHRHPDQRCPKKNFRCSAKLLHLEIKKTETEGEHNFLILWRKGNKKRLTVNTFDCGWSYTTHACLSATRARIITWLVSKCMQTPLLPRQASKARQHSTPRHPRLRCETQHRGQAEISLCHKDNEGYIHNIKEDNPAHLGRKARGGGWRLKHPNFEQKAVLTLLF